MKTTKLVSITALGICSLLFINCVSEVSAAPLATKVLLAQAPAERNSDKIVQVKNGTLKTAHASWWGFDREDATHALQEAINSGVSELIIDNVGSDWIISEPIQLVSDQKIILKDGVVIQAKKGHFQGVKDSLFNGERISNFSLIGEGDATLRMRREEYDNPKLYKKAEWRHGINLIECRDVVIRGFTVEETGGDGLYLGSHGKAYNQNILVEDMVFDANYRQGISVISVDNLTVRKTKFSNTSGTAPQAGIDFEPNHNTQRLTNCIIEDSEFIDNKGSGVEVALMRSDHTTTPISITVKNSYFEGNSRGFAVNPAGRETKDPVGGRIVFEGNTLVGDRITLSNPVVGAIDYLFKDTTIDFTHQNDPETSNWQLPVSIGTTNPAGGRAIGGVRFENVTVLGDVKIPISLSYQNVSTISDEIKGDIYLKHAGQTQKYDLTSFVRKKQAEFQKYNQLQPARYDLEKLIVPKTGKKRSGNSEFYLRNEFTFLQYVEKGEEINITVKSKRIYPRKATIQLVAPSGKTLETYDIPAKSTTFSISFTATETGLYRLVRDGESSNYTDITSNRPGNGLLTMDEQVQFLPTAGNLYFQVPEGVKEFFIGVAGSPQADIALVNPSGKEVERVPELSSMHLFSVQREDATKSEIWSLRVREAVWAVSVKPYAPLLPIVSTNPATMLLKGNE